MKRIAVLTSGGDAPGMNACVRAVVRSAVANGLEVLGVDRGYEGLVGNRMEMLSARSVSNIIHTGGTIIRTSRCPAFHETDSREAAAEALREREVDGLVAIGGDGTMRGLVAFAEQWDGGLIGAPGTIDNDMYGTDFTIGFDTAVNTALEATDRIRDTAQSHTRQFLVEVMGRESGFLALDVAVASGAEQVLIPETPTDLDEVAEQFLLARRRGKKSSIVIVAEGEESGGAIDIARVLTTKTGHPNRATILGHIQRGGSPTARDRILGTKLGAGAVRALMDGKTGVMVGEVCGRCERTPLRDTWEKKKPVDRSLIDLLPILAV